MFNIVLNYWIKRNLEGLNLWLLRDLSSGQKTAYFSIREKPGNKALLKINNLASIMAIIFSRQSWLYRGIFKKLLEHR